MSYKEPSSSRIPDEDSEDVKVYAQNFFSIPYQGFQWEYGFDSSPVEEHFELYDQDSMMLTDNLGQRIKHELENAPKEFEEKVLEAHFWQVERTHDEGGWHGFDEQEPQLPAPRLLKAARRARIHTRPFLTYTALCAMAIHNSPSGHVTSNDVYEFCLHHFPHFKNLKPHWKNTVRNALSHRKQFFKSIGADTASKGLRYAFVEGVMLEQCFNTDCWKFMKEKDERTFVYYKLILQGRDEFLRNRKAAEQQGSGKLLRDRARGDKRKIKKDKGDQSYVISDQASYHHYSPPMQYNPDCNPYHHQQMGFGAPEAFHQMYRADYQF